MMIRCVTEVNVAGPTTTLIVMQLRRPSNDCPFVDYWMEDPWGPEAVEYFNTISVLSHGSTQQFAQLLISTPGVSDECQSPL